MNVERVMTLVKFMKALPKAADKHFDMSKWYKPGKPCNNVCPVIVGKKQLMSCGTTACALGWAAAVPEFKREGLVVKAVEMDGNLAFNNSKIAAMFFELDEDGDEFSEIFGGENKDKTPRAWAKRVKAYLKDLGQI